MFFLDSIEVKSRNLAGTPWDPNWPDGSEGLPDIMVKLGAFTADGTVAAHLFQPRLEELTPSWQSSTSWSCNLPDPIVIEVIDADRLEGADKDEQVFRWQGSGNDLMLIQSTSGTIQGSGVKSLKFVFTYTG